MEIKDFRDAPLVSVCVQTYQHAEFIERCLESIVSQQASFPIEVLVGEDDSDDGTREICERLAAAYAQIRLFLHDRKNVMYIHGIPTGRRNFIHNLNNARGKYIAFCEGDDFWQDPHKLSKQVDFLEQNPDFSIAYHNAVIVDQDGVGDPNQLRLSETPGNVRSQVDIVAKPLMPLASLMFRREHLRHLGDNFLKILNADTYLISYLAQFGKAKFVDVQPSAYRLHSGGIWSPKNKAFKLLSNLHMLRKLHDDIAAPYQPIVARKIFKAHNKYLIQLLKNRQFRDAFREFCQHVAYSGQRFGPRAAIYQLNSYVDLLNQAFFGREPG